MSNGPAIVYRYDGSFNGLLCCVFESYTRRETPADIRCDEEPMLYPPYEVPTDAEHAQRVYTSLSRISKEVQDTVYLCFLSCAQEKELLIYNYIGLCYKHGNKVLGMLTDDTVHAIHKAVRFVLNESHLIVEFLRFAEREGNLVSTVAPKNFVLPLLSEHFCDRFPEENFLIYDKTHGMALVYHPYKAQIIPVENLLLPPQDTAEREYSKLWKQYYKAIAIESRYNPKCRMNHMPKRYWAYMTEFEDDFVQPAVLGEKTYNRLR